jgi:hypothetical protein
MPTLVVDSDPPRCVTLFVWVREESALVRGANRTDHRADSAAVVVERNEDVDRRVVLG